MHPSDLPLLMIVENVDIQVIAEGQNGENKIMFRMRLNQPFKEMIVAWCKYHDIQIAETRFISFRGILTGEETPASYGWSARRGPLNVFAEPADDDDMMPPIVAISYFSIPVNLEEDPEELEEPAGCAAPAPLVK